MTEAEAMTRICCGPPGILQVMLMTDPAYQRTATDAQKKRTGLCSGSACMAWRATDNEGGPFPPGGEPPPMKPAGYCGLAGQP